MFRPIIYESWSHTGVTSDGSGVGLTQKSNKRKVILGGHLHQTETRDTTCYSEQKLKIAVPYSNYIFDSDKKNMS